MRFLARLLVRIFFRCVEVEHAECLDTKGPMVIVAGHRNGLVDALVLMATLPRYPRFLAKSTLFSIPPLWPFLKLARAVPVYRSEDEAPMERNSRAFERTRTILRQGGLIAVFPEGVSHDEPALQPLHTGAARIALESSVEDGTPNVRTVAVSLIYEAKARFRSRAMVRVGRPEAVAGWETQYRHDRHRAVRLLTADLADRLRQVGPDYESWTQADRLARIAEIITRTGDQVLPDDISLIQRQQTAEALAHALALTGHIADRQSADSQSADSQSAVRAVDEALDNYQRDLSRLGLTDAQIMASYRAKSLTRLARCSLAKIVLAAPFAAVGALIHMVPCAAMKWVASLSDNEGMRSTVKLIGCFFTLSGIYIAIGVFVGVEIGPAAGLLAGLVAPACGYVAIRTSERIEQVGGAWAGARWVRPPNRIPAPLLSRRAALVGAAEDLLDRSCVSGIS